MSFNDVNNVSNLRMEDAADQPAIRFLKAGVEKANIIYSGNLGLDKLSIAGLDAANSEMVVGMTSVALELGAGNCQLRNELGPIQLSREVAGAPPVRDTFLILNPSGEVQIGGSTIPTDPSLKFEGVSGNSFTFAFVDASDNLNANGLLKFPSTLPQSAVVPSAGDDLVNKTYVDGLVPTWTSFTPTVDMSGSVSFTAIYAKYFKFGTSVQVQMALTDLSGATAGTQIVVGFGSGGTALPTAANANFSGNYTWDNSGNTIYVGGVVGNSTTSFRLSQNGNANYLATGLTGIALSFTDTLWVSFFYESAT